MSCDAQLVSGNDVEQATCVTGRKYAQSESAAGVVDLLYGRYFRRKPLGVLVLALEAWVRKLKDTVDHDGVAPFGHAVEWASRGGHFEKNANSENYLTLTFSPTVSRNA